MRYTFIFLLSLFILSCNNTASTDTSQTKTSVTAEVSNTIEARATKDSLTQLYNKYYQGKSWFPPHAVIEKGKMYPVDEAPNDTVFFVFRETLLDAVRHKNVFHLLDKIDKNIKCSFGNDEGSAAFVEMWGLDSKAGIDTSMVWAILEDVLSNGGAFLPAIDGMFVAPYFQAVSTDDFYHPNVLVAGQGVRVRSKPNLSSKVIANLSHEIVEIIKYENKEETIGGETFPWGEVKLSSGKRGYIWGKFLISAFDYRAGFKKNENDVWRMTYLVAGD